MVDCTLRLVGDRLWSLNSSVEDSIAVIGDVRPGVNVAWVLDLLLHAEVEHVVNQVLHALTRVA